MQVGRHIDAVLSIRAAVDPKLKIAVDVERLPNGGWSLTQWENSHIGGSAAPRHDRVLIWGIIVTTRSQVSGNADLPGAIASVQLIISPRIRIAPAGIVVSSVQHH